MKAKREQNAEHTVAKTAALPQRCLFVVAAMVLSFAASSSMLHVISANFAERLGWQWCKRELFVRGCWTVVACFASGISGKASRIAIDM
jgi:hypothetical protein